MNYLNLEVVGKIFGVWGKFWRGKERSGVDIKDMDG